MHPKVVFSKIIGITLESAIWFYPTYGVTFKGFSVAPFFVYYSFMEFLTNLWNNQPTTVMGAGAAIVALIGIYISLLQKYQ